MSVFVTATEVKSPRTKASGMAGLLLAAFLILMIVGQLFTYERFATVLDDFHFFANHGAATIAAALLVVCEVAALPFLLRMRLSPLARIVSMVAGWIVVLFWIGISWWLNVTVSLASNSGVLGDTVPVPVGWWMVSFFAALGVLCLWATYGLWPRPSKHTK